MYSKTFCYLILLNDVYNIHEIRMLDRLSRNVFRENLDSNMKDLQTCPEISFAAECARLKILMEISAKGLTIRAGIIMILFWTFKQVEAIGKQDFKVCVSSREWLVANAIQRDVFDFYSLLFIHECTI